MEELNLGSYNWDEVPDVGEGGGGGQLIPEDTIELFEIAEVKQSQSSNGNTMLEVTLKALDNFTGTRIWERFMLGGENLSEKAKNIGVGRLKQLIFAIGKGEEKDLPIAKLQGEIFYGKVKVKKGETYRDKSGEQKQGKDKNEIKAYYTKDKAKELGIDVTAFDNHMPF